MASNENEIIGIIFILILITEVSVFPMANNMYFIQWIVTSYYPNGYKSYRNNSMCIKIACI